MCVDDHFDDSPKMMELYRRERVAYEQMRRHSDAPDGRLHRLWMNKLYQVQQEIRNAQGKGVSLAKRGER
jgi:hypothetical protein